MGKGGDVSASPLAATLPAAASLPGGGGGSSALPPAVAAPHSAPTPGFEAPQAAAPRVSRLSGWRDVISGAAKRERPAAAADEGWPRPVKPRVSPPPLSDRAKLQIAVQEAVRLGPEDLGVLGEASEDEEGDTGPAGFLAGASGRGGKGVARLPGVLPAAPPGTLKVTSPAADGQPVDDTLWGVAPTPPPAVTAAAPAAAVDADAPVFVPAADLCGDGSEADVPHGSLCVPLLRHQRRALAWMQTREAGHSTPVGGLLADDQGLGKTLTAISLIVSCRPPPRPSVPRPAAGSAASRAAAPSPLLQHGVPGGTLVVVPTSVLRQWARELSTRVSTTSALTVLLYHGPSRTRSVADVARADVVLTTYAIVSQELGHRAAAVAAAAAAASASAGASAGATGADGSDAAGGSGSQSVPTGNGSSGSGAGGGSSASNGVLGCITWWRVILDEAQTIKNSRSLVAACMWALLARRRWCLSGTPLQNSVDDLFAYFKFLRHPPFDDPAGFRAAVKEPIRVNPTAGFANLHQVLSIVMLRRTKATCIGGEPIVKLPPRHVALRCVDFSPAERQAYFELQQVYADRFAEYRAAGTVSTNYVNILYMLLRLRQACNHVALVGPATAAAPGGASAAAGGLGASSKPPPASDVAAAKRLTEQARQALLLAADTPGECPVCHDCPEEPVVSDCGALFCRQCWATHVAASATGATPSGGSEEEQDTCPACGASHASEDAYSPAALRLASGAKAAAAGNSPTSFMTGSSAKGGAGAPVMSCKLRAVIEYLNDLRTRSGGVRPSEAFRRSGGTGPGAPGASSGGALNKKDRQRERSQTLRDGIRSSDAALAAALPPLPPVSFTAARSLAAGGSLSGGSGVAEPPEKAIVFSQWTGTLDLLEPALRAEGFNFRRLDGTMSLAAREKALHEFETCPGVSVMLMSLKAAGLGVNLVCANHVLLLDVWWNPTVEEQAIDRSHRIGQRRPVHVCRLTVADTVEARILALQEHKRALAAAAFGEPHAGGDGVAVSAADAAADAQRSRLTVEDLLFLFANKD